MQDRTHMFSPGRQCVSDLWGRDMGSGDTCRRIGDEGEHCITQPSFPCKGGFGRAGHADDVADLGEIAHFGGGLEAGSPGGDVYPTRVEGMVVAEFSFTGRQQCSPCMGAKRFGEVDVDHVVIVERGMGMVRQVDQVMGDHQVAGAYGRPQTAAVLHGEDGVHAATGQCIDRAAGVQPMWRYPMLVAMSVDMEKGEPWGLVDRHPLRPIGGLHPDVLRGVVVGVRCKRVEPRSGDDRDPHVKVVEETGGFEGDGAGSFAHVELGSLGDRHGGPVRAILRAGALFGVVALVALAAASKGERFEVLADATKHGDLFLLAGRGGVVVGGKHE